MATPNACHLDRSIAPLRCAVERPLYSPLPLRLPVFRRHPGAQRRTPALAFAVALALVVFACHPRRGSASSFVVAVVLAFLVSIPNAERNLLFAHLSTNSKAQQNPERQRC